ncbi:MAG: FixH family protein [Proteobacteria bacterium]|nr:FixH family protein [Pseudomonadota bacterium]
MAQPSPKKKSRELTGFAVLMWLVAFFGVVFAVNAVMVKAATSTFGGVETTSSYQAGLKFKQTMANAEKQAELHWHVDGTLSRDKAGEAVLDVSVRDAKGGPVSGLTAQARLEHPADARRDHDVPLSNIGAGQFHGVAAADAGRWELVIDFLRDGKRVFLSRSRVMLN